MQSVSVSGVRGCWEVLDVVEGRVLTPNSVRNRIKKECVSNFTSEGKVTLATSRGRREARLMEVKPGRGELHYAVDGPYVFGNGYCYTDALRVSEKDIVVASLGPMPTVSQLCKLPASAFASDSHLWRVSVVRTGHNVYHFEVGKGGLRLLDLMSALVDTYPAEWFGAGVVERFKKRGYNKSLAFDYPRWNARIGHQPSCGVEVVIFPVSSEVCAELALQRVSGTASSCVCSHVVPAECNELVAVEEAVSSASSTVKDLALLPFTRTDYSVPSTSSAVVVIPMIEGPAEASASWLPLEHASVVVVEPVATRVDYRVYADQFRVDFPTLPEGFLSYGSSAQLTGFFLLACLLAYKGRVLWALYVLTLADCFRHAPGLMAANPALQQLVEGFVGHVLGWASAVAAVWSVAWLGFRGCLSGAVELGTNSLLAIGKLGLVPVFAAYYGKFVQVLTLVERAFPFGLALLRWCGSSAVWLGLYLTGTLVNVTLSLGLWAWSVAQFAWLYGYLMPMAFGSRFSGVSYGLWFVGFHLLVWLGFKLLFTPTKSSSFKVTTRARR